jgi:beta-glucosidase
LPKPDCCRHFVELVRKKVFSESQPAAPESLAFYDIHMKYVVEPGEFEIMVGNSSCNSDLQKVILTVK